MAFIRIFVISALIAVFAAVFVQGGGIVTTAWDNSINKGPSPAIVDESGHQELLSEPFPRGYGFGRAAGAVDYDNQIYYFGLRRVDDPKAPSLIVQYDLQKKAVIAQIEVEPEPIFHTLVWHPVKKALYCFRQSVYGNETTVGTFDMQSGYSKVADVRGLANVWRAYLDADSNTVFAYAQKYVSNRFLWYHRINLNTGDFRTFSNGDYENWNLTYWGEWNPVTRSAIAVAYHYISPDKNVLPEQYVVNYDEATMKFTPIAQIQRPDKSAGLTAWTLDATNQVIYATYHIIFQPDPNLWILTIDVKTGQTLKSSHFQQPYMDISARATMALISGSN